MGTSDKKLLIVNKPGIGTSFDDNQKSILGGKVSHLNPCHIRVEETGYLPRRIKPKIMQANFNSVALYDRKLQKKKKFTNFTGIIL